MPIGSENLVDRCLTYSPSCVIAITDGVPFIKIKLRIFKLIKNYLATNEKVFIRGSTAHWRSHVLMLESLDQL